MADQVKSQVISEENGQNDVKELLLDTISKYQMMAQNSNSQNEKNILETTIKTLYKKIQELEIGEERESNESEKEKNLKFEKKVEKRIKSLREIFEFYSKQQLNAAKPSSFDKMGKQFNSVNLGKFSVMLKQFRIKCDSLVKLLIN